MADLPFDGSIWSSVDRALRNLERIYGRVIEDFDITITEAHILWSLKEQDGQRPSDLARTVGRAATSFTPMLDKLERKALIERRSNTADRRSIGIYLTPVGDKLGIQVVRLLQATDTTLQEIIVADRLSNFLSVIQTLQTIHNTEEMHT